MATRDIRAHLREMYDVDVSPDLISRVTDAVVEKLQEGQSRPLDAVYPGGQDPDLTTMASRKTATYTASSGLLAHSAISATTFPVIRGTVSFEIASSSFSAVSSTF